MKHTKTIQQKLKFTAYLILFYIGLFIVVNGLHILLITLGPSSYNKENTSTNMKILILAPTKAEYTATLQSLEQVKHGDNVIVRCCGAGPALASACLASEDPTKYDAVILIGYCGSNKVDYPVGSTVYPRFADYFSINPELDCLKHLNVTYDLLGIDEVTIYSSEHFVTDTPLTGLFDMEAASLATVLADYAPDVPLVVARMVSDNPNDPNNETAFDTFDIDDFSGLLAGAFELIDSHFYWSEEK